MVNYSNLLKCRHTALRVSAPFDVGETISARDRFPRHGTYRRKIAALLLTAYLGGYVLHAIHRGKDIDIYIPQRHAALSSARLRDQLLSDHEHSANFA